MAAAQGSPTTSARQSSVFKLEGEAHALADRLPELVLDAWAMVVPKSVSAPYFAGLGAGLGADR